MEEKTKIDSVKLKNYKIKFRNIQAFKAIEETTMHIANGEKYFLKEGDFFVMLDLVNCLTLRSQQFKKLFIIKEDE